MSQDPSSTSPELDAILTPQRIKEAVRAGVGAMALAQVASQLVSIGSLAILLRLLAPADYGLLNMVVPLVMFLRIFTILGLNLATVQQRDLRADEISALFWLNVLFGIATAGVTAAIAPALGWLYDKPDLALSLKHVALALSGTAIVAALGTQHQAILERHLRMRNLGTIRVSAQLCGAMAAIAAALAGWGMWALVVQQYVELGLLAILAWITESWRPGLPRFVSRHLRLGGFFAASSVVFYFADNVDRVLVGWFDSPQAVGFYSQAYNLMIKPAFVLVTPLIALMVSSLSRLHDDAPQRQQLVVSFYRLAAILILPASVGLIVLGTDVMLLFGGEKWEQAGPLLSVLAIGMFPQTTIILGGPVLIAAGRTDRLFYGSLIVAMLLLSGYVIGGAIGQSRGAPAVGVAWGYALTAVALMVPYTRYCLRTVGYDPREVFRTFLRPLVAALTMGICLWIFRHWLTFAGPIFRLAVLVPLGMLIYFGQAHQELAWLWQHARQLGQSRRK